MNTLTHHLTNRPWRFIDQSTLGRYFEALQSFAYDDALCIAVGTSSSDSILRTWVHHHTVVLGIQDSRLPFVQEGIEYLEDQGYHVIVRNSGGLAVVLDEGILNVSLILKEEKKFSINDGYEFMFALIQQLLLPYGVDVHAKEVIGSYCPGSYDLSIDGKKFAGISQRRIRGGVAVQIYLCVSGSGSERAKLIQTFYSRAVQGQPTAFEYPKIVPETMASLTELLNEELTVQAVIHQLLLTCKEQGAHLSSSSFTELEMQSYEEQYVRIIKRNERING
ncbi:lipoate--protein ligase family protein [Alkalihalobacillus sp. BA299]|uniref:lipoate--protein ligase family protein n=1 Tax=Alkalihalobacillus sp. BA299 TaxID=2815938 RepID=UPI001ADCE7A7|nr:lipoate--protein ligase family protein [Alkalihalobacillus sp. BA299]